MASTQGYTGMVEGPPDYYYTIRPDRGPPPHRAGPAYPQPEESQPLLGAQNGRFPPAKSDTGTSFERFKFLAVGLAVILLPLILGWGLGYTTAYDPVCDSSERNKIRKEWDLETAAHRQEITKLFHEKDVMRREWVVEHDNLMEFRRDVEAEYQRWEEQRQQWDKERRQWREEHKRHEEEEKEHERRLIQWGPLQKDEECVSYGTARYQARLQYVPPAWDQYNACTETRIRIHQIDLLPTECRYNNVSSTSLP